MEAVFEKIKELGWVDTGIENATEEQIEKVERILNVTFPISYKMFITKYLNVRLGSYELLSLNIEDNIYMVSEFEDAKQYFDLPKHLIPFLEDNGDYFCFDTTKINDGEYSVKYWSHNGTTNEKWDNFMDWVEKCWLGEYLKSQDL